MVDAVRACRTQKRRGPVKGPAYALWQWNFEVPVKQLGDLGYLHHPRNRGSYSYNTGTHTCCRTETNGRDEQWHHRRQSNERLESSPERTLPLVSHFFGFFGLGLVVFFGFGYGDTVVAPYVLDLFGCGLIEDACQA